MAAITKALPEAVQVADRRHLLEIVSAPFLAAVQSSMLGIRKAICTIRLDPTLLTAQLVQTARQRLRHMCWCRRFLPCLEYEGQVAREQSRWLPRLEACGMD